MNKIVYLVEQPLDERNCVRFGIQHWIDRGWEVEVWDLTPMAHPRFWQSFIASGGRLNNSACHFPIATREELECRYSGSKGLGYFIDVTGEDPCCLRVKLRLIRRGAKRVSCRAGSIPNIVVGEEQPGLVARLREEFRNRGLSIWRWLAEALIRKLAMPLAKPGLIVVPGHRSLRSAMAAGHNEGIIQAHNYDYDLFLQLRDACHEDEADFAVFLDQDICFHPDYITEGYEQYVDPESYYHALCSGLRSMAGTLGVDLKIAAHPRVSLDRQGKDWFEGIPTEYGKTAELISRCKFVVCHYSTALQLAVLFVKPVVFVTTNGLDASPAGKFIANFAAVFDKPVINLDGDLSGVDWREVLRVDGQRYDAYRTEYIKLDGSPEKPFWDIVIDSIEKNGGRES